MNKNPAGTIIVLLIACLALFGCFIEFDPDNIETAAPYGDGTWSGNVEGVGEGYIGKIRVALEISNGVIAEIDIIHFETSNIGGAFIQRVKPLIKKANSFEIDVITSASCEGTRNGLLEAGRAAIKQIPGVE